MPSESKKLVLIDANALMHRAYHALPPLTTKKGEIVNAVYGFTSVLLKVIKELKPDYMICAFDVAGGTFRDKIYKEYKAGRVKPGQEFYDQIPKIKEVIRAFNIPIVEKQGFEADDIIGSIAKQVCKSQIPDKSQIPNSKSQINPKFQILNLSQRGIGDSKLQTIIITGDLDTLQLVDKNTEVYTLRKGIKDTIIYNKEAVEKRYGLEPKQIIDFKALRGDPSDNIPGVKGIGEKGAIDLLKNFGTVENLYKAIEENKTGDLVKPRVKEKLIQKRREAFLSKKLAAIRKDLKIDIDLEKSKCGSYDEEKLGKLFRELEFYSLMDRVRKANHFKSDKPQIEDRGEKKKYVRCVILDTGAKVKKFLSELRKQKMFVFETKSGEEDTAEGDLTGIIFLWEKSPIYYAPLVFKENKPNLFNVSALSDDPFLEKVKPILEDEKCKKIGYFFKKDIKALLVRDIEIKGLRFDIMLAAYLLDPGRRDYSKKKIIFDHLGSKDSKTVENENEIKKKINHASEIVLISHFFELYGKLKKNLGKAGMEDLFCKIEMPLTKVLAKMEINGIKIDTVLLKDLSRQADEKISDLAGKIHKLSGNKSFNINSSQQLAQVLFEKMKLPAADIKKTQTGYSTSASELEKLKSEHIIIDFISQYRELVKLKNTYIDALPKLINKKTGRLHTTFHQTVTSTGRLSSSNPNLQNIPARTEIGRKIRRAFVAEPGRKLLSADYSQIELRIIAIVANDVKMKEIFNKNLDVHTATAAEINQILLEEVTQEMRRAAKALNFGVIYGMSVFGFAVAAGVDRDKAKKFIDDYFKKFSEVAKYIEKSKGDARKKGYAETLWGRRRYLPELNSSNSAVRSAAERMAINMPIQGTAADIMKIAMINVDRWMESYNKSDKDAVRLLLQVHDELLFSIKKENLQEAAREIKRIMESGHLESGGKKINFSVPIKVEIKAGDNWEEMKLI